MKRDTKFRRMHRSNQIGEIENEVDSLNSRLGLDRVNLAVDTDRLYIPGSQNGKHALFSGKVDNEYSQIIVTPIRVDCLDISELTAGKRIKSDKEVRDVRAGLYLVCELDTFRLPNGDISCGIAWIPLGDRDVADFDILPTHKADTLDNF